LGLFFGVGPPCTGFDPRKRQHGNYMHMACPLAASVVVVGVDDSAISYAFDALVENEDGERACIVPN